MIRKTQKSYYITKLIHFDLVFYYVRGDFVNNHLSISCIQMIAYYEICSILKVIICHLVSTEKEGMFMKIKRNRWDIVIHGIIFLLLIGTGIYLFLCWKNVPSQVSSHFNSAGEIDEVTDKSSIWIVYSVGWILCGGLMLIECFPQIWNTGVEINEQNQESVYRLLKNMLMCMCLLIAVFFSILCYFTVEGKDLPIFSSPIFLILMFGSLAYFLMRIYKTSKE